MKRNNKTINILWTGGFDSTYRITFLSLLPVTIQPYYIKDNRQSETNEIKAIETIKNLLSKHKNTRAKILPVIYIDKDDSFYPKHKIDAYRNLTERAFMGDQYIWLSAFAEKINGLELSIHKDDKAVIMINKYGSFKKDSFNNNVINEQKSSPQIIELFKPFSFPLINITKKEMEQWYIQNGYQNVMEATWFCFTPINNKPCGKCNACKYAIKEGMKKRFTKKALARYHIHNLLTPLLPIIRKIRHNHKS